MNIEEYKPKSGRVIFDDNIVRNVGERVTRGIRIINSDHALNHFGRGLKFYLSPTSLVAAASLEYCFTTAVDYYIHFKNVQMSSFGSSLRFEVIRNPTVTLNTGTLINISNTNDNSTYVHTTTLRATPTYNSGTSWHYFDVLVDTSNPSTSLNSYTANENEEIIFKKNTQYIFKLTNIGTATITRAFIAAFFYEEDLGYTGG